MPRPDIPTHFISGISLIGLATLVAWPVHAQPAPTGQSAPNAVSVERSAIFDVTPVTGTLKETVRKEQQLVWRARRSPNERRFQLTDMSVAFLRNQAPGEVKITFVGHVSAFGWRPDGEPKLNVTARTRGGASIYSWTFDVSVRCADSNRPICFHQHYTEDGCRLTVACRQQKTATRPAPPKRPSLSSAIPRRVARGLRAKRGRSCLRVTQLSRTLPLLGEFKPLMR